VVGDPFVIARSGSDEAISKSFLALLRTDSAIPTDSPSPGGRELEGGGNSPSPYSSPIKGEEISAEIARHVLLL